MRDSRSLSLFVVLLLRIGLSFPAECQGTTPVPGTSPVTTDVFDSSFVKALYKGTFDISKNHLGGLFMIKRTAQNSIRILFSNEFGMKIFDFEFRRDTFLVHYCFPSMERKSLLNLLEKDLRLLLVPDLSVKKTKPVKSKDAGLLVLKIRSLRGSFLYSYDKVSGRIRRVQTSGAVFGKTDLQLSGDSGLQPAGISLDNPVIGLHIKMTLLGD